MSICEHIFSLSASVPIEFSFPSYKISEHILLLLLLQQHRDWCIEEVFAGNLASPL